MEFKMTQQERIINLAGIFVIIFFAGKLFYGTFFAGIFLIPIGVILFRQRKKSMIEKKIAGYEIQFKDMLISVSDALSTGYSVENAFKESYRDLKNIYGYDSDICREMRLMLSSIKLNVNIETVIWDFATRSGLKNAKMFAEIFCVAKRTGGNMTSIIKSVTDNIVLKESVKEEIQVAVSEKKTEQKVMTMIPMFLILYVSASSPGFLTIMYETIMGKIVMTICLICYVSAYIWAEKIMQIKI